MITPQNNLVNPGTGWYPVSVGDNYPFKTTYSSDINITNEITLECWVYMDALPEFMPQKFPALISRTNETYRFGVHSQDTSKMGLRLNYPSADTVEAEYVLSSSVVGVWTHFAVTFDGRYVTFYENAEIVHTYDHGSIKTIDTSTNPDDIINFCQGWEGSVIEARVWNIAKTQDQIKAMYKYRATGREPNLVVCCPFKDGQFDIMKDWANKVDLIPNEGPLHLNTSSGARLTFANKFWSGLISEFTIEMDLNLSQGYDYATSSYLKIMGDEDYTNKDGFYLGDYAKTGDIGLRVGNGTNRYGVWGNMTGLGDKEWHRMSVVFNNGTITFYDDGVLTNSGTSTGVSSVSTGGAVPNSMGGNDLTDLLIRNVKFWDYARTQTEIQNDIANYTLDGPDLTGNEAGLVAYYPVSIEADDITSLTVLDYAGTNNGTLDTVDSWSGVYWTTG